MNARLQDIKSDLWESPNLNSKLSEITDAITGKKVFRDINLSRTLFSTSTPKTIADTTEDTILIEGDIVIPANTLKVGDVLRFRAFSILKNAGTPTNGLKIYIKNSAGSDKYFYTDNAKQTTNSAYTLVELYFEVLLSNENKIIVNGWERSYGAANPTRAIYTNINTAPVIDPSDSHSIVVKYKWGATNTVTSGDLVVGKTYRIEEYKGTDDFTNVSTNGEESTVISGEINTDGCVFVATGTTPTDWTGETILSLLDSNVISNTSATLTLN